MKIRWSFLLKLWPRFGFKECAALKLSRAMVTQSTLELSRIKPPPAQLMTITTNALGKSILVGTCPFTGRREIETFDCPPLQVAQILIDKPLSVYAAVSVAELRWNKAAKIRRSRAARRERARAAYLALGFLFDED